MTVFDLSAEQARAFFMEPENYGSTELPQYFDFTGILSVAEENVAEALRSKKLLQSAKEYERVNYTLTSNKDGKYAWRPLQLIHPLLYATLVHEITIPDNWSILLDLFEKYKALPSIECASYPVVKDKRKKQQADQILSWWSNFEQRSLELALRFGRMMISDITDCYGSIYTHAIAWSIHGKPTAKKDHSEKLLGNIIDHRIQAMRNGQTNGIPQGSVLMDFIAEIVLGYADSQVAEQLESIGVKDYYILRYRDDYRIFVNDSWTGEKVLKVLTGALFDLGMRLNSAKTKMSDDIITDSVKEDKLAWLSLDNNFRDLSFEKKLLMIYNHASRFPNCGSMIKPLVSLHKKMGTEFLGDEEQVLASISIVAELAYRHPKVYPVCVAIIADLLIRLAPDIRGAIAATILHKFNHLPNTGYLQVWLQRIAIPNGIQLNYSEGLCQRVIDETCPLWENKWLETAPDIKTALEGAVVINKEKIATLTPTMSNEEIDLFVSNYEANYQG